MQEKISDKYDENKMELDFVNESENVKKKMKRKKNKQSEAPIDKKKVKLENAEDKLSENPSDNNHGNILYSIIIQFHNHNLKNNLTI